MKTIIIAGGGRKAGKTTLANTLGQLLPDSKIVKLGHHPPKKNKPSLYFHTDTSFGDILASVKDCKYLVIESGALLDDTDLTPDLVIFLPSTQGPDKPGSERRREKAHLIRGEPIGKEKAQTLQSKMELIQSGFQAVLNAVGVLVDETQA
jgi:hypothetical protein